MTNAPRFDLDSLSILELSAAYRSGRTSPLAVVETLLERIASAPNLGAWIALLPQQRVLEQAQSLASLDPQALPLYGIPFAIKDNIDLADVPTTAGCPAFAYLPTESAFVVARLIEAGAIPIGKTNLDQFATGLVGTRSPFGVCHNSFDPKYISGGSSSGSAVAVAAGWVSFALGTDTAGSGRVPAAFNNLIGLKPTLGSLSTRGVVPACRTLDCVSVFALNAEDAERVYAVASAFDAADPYARRRGRVARRMAATPSFRFGVPQTEQLEFFGNDAYRDLFEQAAERLERLGGQRIPIDFSPFQQTAQLLYQGPWIAERYAAVESLLQREPQALHPVTRQIIEGGAQPTAVQAFRAQYRLQALRRMAEGVWQQIDTLLTPTAPTIYTIAEVEADPIELNSRLGYYTNFMNLLDLSAIAVPAGFTATGLPFGVTLAAPAWNELDLLQLASRLQRSDAARSGASTHPLTPASHFAWPAAADDVPLAVCGAHLSGLALNHQLLERGAVLIERTTTAACYRLYALPGGPPQRPGLVRVNERGAPIEVEVWSMPDQALGSFVAAIPAPLGIGKLLLEDSREVCGFVCEAHAIADAQDITSLGGWRAYLAQRA